MDKPIPEDLIKKAQEQVRAETSTHLAAHPEILDKIKREYAAFSAGFKKQNRPVPESEEAFIKRRSTNYAMMAKIQPKLRPDDPTIVEEHFGGALPKGWDDLVPEAKKRPLG